MENQNETPIRRSDGATFCPTKGGNGYKVVVNGVWYYISKRTFLEALENGRSCVFHKIEDRPTDEIAAKAASLYR